MNSSLGASQLRLSDDGGDGDIQGKFIFSWELILQLITAFLQIAWFLTQSVVELYTKVFLPCEFNARVDYMILMVQAAVTSNLIFDIF